MLACRRADIPAGRGWPFRAGERNLAVFDLGDTVVAVDNECRHVGNPIDDGFVSGASVTCPWHGWRYDLRTGELITVFGRRPGLCTYEVRVDSGDVFVEVPD